MTLSDNASPRIAIYVRVSTEDQVEFGSGLDTQERLCHEYCEREFGPGRYSDTVFREEARSGGWQVRQFAKKGDAIRPVLSDLLDAAERGEFTHIVTNEVSRISREDFLWKCIRHLTLKPRGVSLRIVSGNLDLDDDHDAFTADLLALLAGRERAQASARSIAGHESRRKAGLLASGTPPWGWVWEDETSIPPGGDRRIVPDAEKAPWVPRMIQMLTEEGIGTRRIATRMQQTGLASGRKGCRWTSNTVRRIVNSPIHAGFIRLRDGTLARGEHCERRLIEPELHHRVVETLASRYVVPRRTIAVEDFPLAGILRCGHCGARLHTHRTATPDRTRYYLCPKPQDGSPRDCPGVMRKAQPLEIQVGVAVSEFASGELMSRLIGDEAERLLAERRQERSRRLEEIRGELAQLDTKLTRWAEAFTAGTMGEAAFARVSAQWQEQFEQLEVDRRQAEQDLTGGDTERAVLAQVRRALQDFAGTWQQLPAVRQRAILLQLVETLTLQGEEGVLLLRVKLRFLPERQYTLTNWRKRRPEGVNSLTDRQLAALKLLDDGMSISAIARQWLTSDGGVRGAIRQAKRTAGIDDLASLIEAARPRIEEALPRLPLTGRVQGWKGGAVLSDWEHTQLLPRLAAGATQKALAAELNIHPNTISARLASLRNNLNLGSSGEVIAWWREHQVTDGTH